MYRFEPGEDLSVAVSFRLDQPRLENLVPVEAGEATALLADLLLEEARRTVAVPSEGPALIGPPSQEEEA